MPTKTPATMIRLSCSHFSNWPTQPLVWMEPCCSSSWWAGEGYTRALDSAHPPPQASSQSCRQAHLAPGPHASAPAAWSSATGLPIAGSFSSSGSRHRCPSSKKPPLTSQPQSHYLLYFIFFQALSWNGHITAHISGFRNFLSLPPLEWGSLRARALSVTGA